jgi:23S rRNA pseudouridine2605 synthase
VPASDKERLPQGEGVRLQKVLAQAGIASRRASEELIEAGRVSVDGTTVTHQGMRVDPETAIVRVDGERVTVSTESVYLALNKPKGYVSAMSDPDGRPTVAELIPGSSTRVYHVGRLDADTEGLLLLTNDGELANRLMHPSYGVPKTYLADVAGRPPKGLAGQLKKGFELEGEDRPVVVDRFRIMDEGIGKAQGRTLVELVLHEGRKHVVRRLLAACELPVRRLVRTAVGEVQLGSLAPGKTRRLTREEVASLYRLVDL